MSSSESSSAPAAGASSTSPPTPVELLQAKIVLHFTSAAPWEVYQEIRKRIPNALEQPWSASMEEPLKHVVLDGNTFSMVEVADAATASGMANQPPIEAGNSIILYVDSAEKKRTDTLSESLLSRSPSQTPRKGTPSYMLYNVLAAFIAQIKGGN